MLMILMRHGEAVPFAPRDEDRPLTPTGQGEATQVGRRLVEAGFAPAAIAHSTRLRAHQTASLVAALCVEQPQVVEWSGITPDDHWQQALAVLEAGVCDQHLVVFHQPILAQILGYLLEGDPNFDVQPRPVPATAYVLDCDHWLPGSARLLAAYTPE